jgi:hypothetical protein
MYDFQASDYVSVLVEEEFKAYEGVKGICSTKGNKEVMYYLRLYVSTTLNMDHHYVNRL